VPELERLGKLADITIKNKVVNSPNAMFLVSKVTVTPLKEERIFLAKIFGLDKVSELSHAIFCNGSILDVTKDLMRTIGIDPDFNR
jgi:hypothetical protein